MWNVVVVFAKKEIKTKSGTMCSEETSSPKEQGRHIKIQKLLNRNSKNRS